jgi:hypothetical protein
MSELIHVIVKLTMFLYVYQVNCCNCPGALNVANCNLVINLETLFQESSPYLKENTTLHHYKDQMVDGV